MTLAHKKADAMIDVYGITSLESHYTSFMASALEVVKQKKPSQLIYRTIIVNL